MVNAQCHGPWIRINGQRTAEPARLIPLLKRRRGGCAIKKISRSHLGIAQTGAQRKRDSAQH